jgi:hypothetical protein
MAGHCQMGEYQTRPYVTLLSVARAHTGASSCLRSVHLNIPNKVKLWHRSAPLLIVAATMLGLTVILYR